MSGSVLDHRVAVAPAAPATPTPPGHKTLGLAMQHQKQDEWCWATLSASVAAFYGGDAAARRWTQCRVVNAALGRTSCCTEGGSAECNRPYQPEKALALVGHLDRDFGGPLTIDQIAAQIDEGRPVGACIDWTGGGGHVVAVAGYDSALGTIDVLDSLFGPSYLPLASFPAHYQGGGTWGWTYLTSPGGPEPAPCP